MYLLCIPSLLPSQCDASLDTSLAPLQAFVACFLHGVRRKILPVTQCLSNLAGHRSLLTHHNLYHLLRYLFFGVLQGSQFSVCSGMGVDWVLDALVCLSAPSHTPCSLFQFRTIPVAVSEAHWGFFCLCFGCSKSTFESPLSLLLDFL